MISFKGVTPIPQEAPKPKPFPGLQEAPIAQDGPKLPPQPTQDTVQFRGSTQVQPEPIDTPQPSFKGGFKKSPYQVTKQLARDYSNIPGLKENPRYQKSIQELMEMVATDPADRKNAQLQKEAQASLKQIKADFQKKA